jgi:hypothetical protein
MAHPALRRSFPVTLLTLAATLTAPSGAQDKGNPDKFEGNPSVTSHWPRGAQRGTTVEVEFTGTRLGDPRSVVCLTTPAITCAKVTALPASANPPPRPGNPPTSTAVATLLIAPDCPSGQHVIRLLTSSGVADLATFWIGSLPEVVEQEHANNSKTDLNGTREQAETIPLDRTVNGTLNGMEPDTFRIELKQGQLFTA